MRNNFKRTLAVIASAAVMGNALLAAMPVSVFAEEAGGIVGNSNSSEISNVSDQGQNEGYAGGIVGNDDALLINNGNYAVQDSDSSVPYVVSNVETDASTNSSNWVCLNLKVTQTSVIIEEIDGDSRTTHTVEGNFGSLTMLRLKYIIADISGIEAEKLLLNYNGVVIYDDSFDDYEFSETSYYNIYYQQGYCNNVSNLENGSVSVDKPLAAEGDVITLTALPDKGYVFDGWKVTAGGEGATITVVNNQFNMPAKDVYYSATFVECEHTGGKATCMNGMICDTCETEYNQTLDPDNHVSNTYTNGFRDCCGEYQPATDTDGNGVYEIANAGQLYWFMEHVNAGNTETDAILTTDITVNENVLNDDGMLNGDGSDFRSWFPIGYCYDCDDDGNKENIYYNGTFDGQGHTISGLYLNNAKQSNVGLFGQIDSDAEICNVILSDIYFSADDFVSGVCGENEGTVTNCRITGLVNGGEMIGGICGANLNKITNCINGGSVEGEMYVGGVCGYNQGVSITDCGSTGDVNGTENVGGVCGYNTSDSIARCYNTGDVNGTKSVGGVCGYNYYSAITNCINSGNVEGEMYVGGLCGYNYQAEFTNCYSIGNVYGTEYIGGVCGYKYNGEITDCYYNSDIFAGDAFGYLYTDGFGTIDDDFGRITECFKKGEIAHLLQSAQTETDEEGNILHVWGQTLGEDTYPVLGGDKVYRIENCQNVVIYSNTYRKSGHVYINGKCDVCGGLCSHESYTNGICDDCEAVCSHESYTNGECDECDVVCSHESYTNGDCDECDIVCSHESYTNGECDECDIVCEHNYYDEEKGYIINDYYAADHVIACHICGFEKTEEHTYDGGNCITCGFDKLSSGADFICKEDLEFDEYESKGSLETDGYEWNHETKTLTLGNIHVNGDIILPYYAADENESLANTIVISGSSTAVITGNICGSPYDQSLTIKSSDPANKGTIKTGISNSNVGHNDILTIKDVNLITESLMWMTNGGIAVEGAEFKVSEYCFIEAITIDEASTFELGTEIGGYGNVENGLSDIAHHLPKGYTLVTDGELTYVADSNGVRVEETVVFDGSTVTPCVDDNNDGICDSCGGYSDGIGAKLAGYTISLNGNIGVNFYMTLDKTIRNDENAYMLFTLPNGNTKKILVSEAEQNTELVYGKTYYVFSCEVSSKEMTDEIKAQITDGNGKSGTEYTYTVREYAEYIINNADSYTEDDVAFVKSMLNYGAASQNFFKNNTDDLANKNLSAEEQVIAELEAADLDEYISYAVSNEIGTFAGYSLVLESETVLKAYFKPTEGIDMNNITFTINGNDAEAVKSGDYYVLSAENIKAWDLDTMYVFRAVCGETELEFKASVMSYAYSVLNAGDVYSAELRQLVCALREYQQKSEVYISANSIDS